MRPSCPTLKLYLCQQDKTPPPPATASPPQPTAALQPGQPPPGRGTHAAQPTQTRGAQHGSPSPLALCCHGKPYYAADQALENRVSVPFCSPAATFRRPVARPVAAFPSSSRKSLSFFFLKRPTLLPLLGSPRQAWARPQRSWCGRRPDHGWEVSGALAPGTTSPSAVLSSRVT